MPAGTSPRWNEDARQTRSAGFPDPRVGLDVVVLIEILGSSLRLARGRPNLTKGSAVAADLEVGLIGCSVVAGLP